MTDEAMREETLVRNLLQHQRVIEAMITAMVGDPATAEDLFQEMAILMTRKREEADEECKFVAWARRIAINLVRDHRKKLARSKIRMLDDETLEQVSQVFEDLEASAWEARREALQKCSERLPERGRTLLRRRYAEGAGSDQIAAEQSLSRGAVDTMLYRLRKALHDCIRLRLQEAGLS
jgi:RNA polymerase sigma-70 factor (ECF subfamily)